MREYSIYSPVDAPYLEILVREVAGGYVSPRLSRCRPGDLVYVEGPFGFFLIDAEQRRQPLVFIATGTGISPFHCFALSYRDLDYRLMHGVRYTSERYESTLFDPSRYVACLTQDAGGDFAGRVTEYLRLNPVAPNSLCYLCGNCDMIYQCYDILHSQGVGHEHMFAEVYF